MRNAARPGRLRWLQGHRNGVDAWDAYEAAPGTPLTSLLRTPQPWKNVRHWLLDLAEEFAAATRDGSMPAQLSLDRVWITASGGAKLLDFRAPGAEPTAQRVEPVDASQPDAGQVFLNQLAISALEGRAASADEARTRVPGVPLSLAARTFLHELRATVDFAGLTQQLKSLVHETPYVSRRRRLGLIAGCTLPAVIFGAMAFAGVALRERWQKDNPEFDRLRRSLSRHNEYRDGATGLGPHPAQSMEIYIAGHFGDFIRDPRKWNSQLANGIPAKWRLDAEKIVAARPHPTAEEMQKRSCGTGAAARRAWPLQTRSVPQTATRES